MYGGEQRKRVWDTEPKKEHVLSQQERTGEGTCSLTTGEKKENNSDLRMDRMRVLI